MRHIGNVPTEFDAVRLGDHLFTMGIEVQVEPLGGEWEVWVRDEDKVDVGRRELCDYCAAPRDPRYDAAQASAAARRKEIAQERRQAQSLQVDARDQWQSPMRRRRPLVLLLALLCALVFVFTSQGARDSALRSDLTFCEIKPDGRVPVDGWVNIRSGEVWRLVTPAFLHFSWAHLIMNLLALNYLGGLIEDRRGTVYLAIMVLVLAVASNVVQYWWTNSPMFGGISGVVFGLFGYLWMMTQFRPAAGMVMSRETIVMTLIFYVVCVLSGMEIMADSLGRVLPSIANAAHTAGLLVGMAWGFLAAKSSG